MRLYLINPSNPLVSIVKVKESRWNRYRVWKPLSLMVLAGLAPREWDISILDENFGALVEFRWFKSDRDGFVDKDGEATDTSTHVAFEMTYSW